MTFRLTVVVLAASMLAASANAQRSGGRGGSMPSQFHGIGGSITSFGPSAPTQFGTGDVFRTHGIPPSVTSITPSPNSRFSGGFNSERHGRNHGGRHRNFTPFFPIYSYPYYSYDDSGLYPDSNGSADTNYQQPDADPPAMTVFENRPGYRPPPPVLEQSAPAASREPAQPAQPEAKVADQAPTILVFRDGRQLEVSNYAIQGETLYNLSGDGPRKIKLADLDLAKTVKLNDERGNEFRLPKKTQA